MTASPAPAADSVRFGASTPSAMEISMGLLNAIRSPYLVVRTFAVQMAHMVLRAFWDQPRLDIVEVARHFRAITEPGRMNYASDTVQAYADAVEEVRLKAPSLIRVHEAILKEMESRSPDRHLRAILNSTARMVLISVSEDERDLQLRWYARELVIKRLKARRL